MRTPMRALLNSRRLAVTFCCAQQRSAADALLRPAVVRFGRQVLNRLRQIFSHNYGPGPLLQEGRHTESLAIKSKPLLGGWASKILNSGVDGAAANIARGLPVKRLVYGSKESMPLLAFVGVTLATGKGFLTEQDQMRSLCEQIRQTLNDKESHASITGTDEDVDRSPTKLEDLQVADKIIGKGCNAVVLAAKLIAESALTQTSLDQPGGTRNQFNGYNLAVKMMFNYDAESNAPAILKAMLKEIIPAPTSAIGNCPSLRGNFKKILKPIPAHRNIIEMRSIFTDNVLGLPGAMQIYPDALPRRLNIEGSGRNKTLFIVMPRYHSSMAEYLSSYVPSNSTRLILLTQLLEGVAHLVKNQVAHRDLKADNILLDLSEGFDLPHLVISDFGCCLADRTHGLKIPYYTEETDRGGNLALMAPEVACAVPGYATYIDYGKADLWAVGALAYEIWGQDNPFYVGKRRFVPLDTEDYAEDQLPELSAQPNQINGLVTSLLQRDPRHRPTAAVAATVCQLLLFCPQEWMSVYNKPPRSKKLMEWIVNLAAVTLCQMRMGPVPKTRGVEYQLRFTFLTRVTVEDVAASLSFIRM